MIERPLLTPDELKTLPKGHFVVMKTGARPMISKLKLFFKWGISFGKPYEVPEHSNRRVEYIAQMEIEDAIIDRYLLSDTEPKPDLSKIMRPLIRPEKHDGNT